MLLDPDLVPTPPRLRVCPDCPATRTGILSAVAKQASGCAFRCVAVEARQTLPTYRDDEYGVALVRRGIVIRQRVDAQGRATAIDIVGPGSAFPVAPREDGGLTGYAVDDLMLCLCPSSIVTSSVDAGNAEARSVVRVHASTLGRVERIAEARSRATATSRVAALMVMITDTLSGSDHPLDSIPGAIQQRDLASLVGLRHESVCRIIKALLRRGVLERQPHGLRIVDRAALEAV